MNRQIFKLFLSCTTALLISNAAVAQTILPSDPQTKNCALSSNDFGSWIKGESETGLLFKPANSVEFQPIKNTKCDFYKWSAQMFLWATSSAAEYGGKGYVFESPIFFDVHPAQGNARKLASENPATVFWAGLPQTRIVSRFFSPQNKVPS